MLNETKLRELMSEKGITSFRKLSELTKIPYTTISYMINGHDMFLSTAVEIAKFFQVPVDYLVNKSYGVVFLKGETERKVDTSSLIEATFVTMV